MAANSEGYIQHNKKIIRKIFRQKEEFHKSRARLPIEEKIKMLIELQKIALTVRPKRDENDKRMVWQI
jgi:hypothetical protein